MRMKLVAALALGFVVLSFVSFVMCSQEPPTGYVPDIPQIDFVSSQWKSFHRGTSKLKPSIRQQMICDLIRNHLEGKRIEEVAGMLTQEGHLAIPHYDAGSHFPRSLQFPLGPPVLPWCTLPVEGAFYDDEDLVIYFSEDGVYSGFTIQSQMDWETFIDEQK